MARWIVKCGESSTVTNGCSAIGLGREESEGAERALCFFCGLCPCKGKRTDRPRRGGTAAAPALALHTTRDPPQSHHATVCRSEHLCTFRRLKRVFVEFLFLSPHSCFNAHRNMTINGAPLMFASQAFFE